jgi:hypothetical protein
VRDSHRVGSVDLLELTGIVGFTATSMRSATAAGCETATEWEASISSS